jgi:hypothetical protein
MSGERKQLMLQRLYGWSTLGGRVRFRGALRRTPAMDTTAYLLSSKANERWIDAALEESRTGRSIELTVDELRDRFGLGSIE